MFPKECILFFMQLTKKQISDFQEKILSWYEEHQRDLPWRNLPKTFSKDERAYRILISEVMSQQTQIQRVVSKYTAWLEKFPTVVALANASIADVLQYWSGLGYNRRALNLKKAAEMIATEYGGHFPDEEKALLALPGIGQYTARAVLCFAFNHQLTVVDTNVRKVILLEILLGNASLDTPQQIQSIADQLLPLGKAYEWNQALMDYAGSVLKQEKITIPKQSTFLGSHRYYRGQVLKVLLKKGSVKQDELGVLIKKQYAKAEAQWLMDLLEELRKEGFIRIDNEIVRLSS
jgi:A/G-specific adenine glycosylase